MVETENVRFIENGEVSGSGEPHKVEINEVWGQIHLPCLSSKFVSPQVVLQPNNQPEQQINAPANHNEVIIDEPVVDVPQKVA